MISDVRCLLFWGARQTYAIGNVWRRRGRSSGYLWPNKLNSWRCLVIGGQQDHLSSKEWTVILERDTVQAQRPLFRPRVPLAPTRNQNWSHWAPPTNPPVLALQFNWRCVQKYNANRQNVRSESRNPVGGDSLWQSSKKQFLRSTFPCQAGDPTELRHDGRHTHWKLARCKSWSWV